MSSRRAFTLIEMLIVIAIIGVLMGLLLPALSRARIAAKVAKAKVELHQVGIAAQLYRNDHDSFPLTRTYCATNRIDDYYELPPELEEHKYLSSRLVDAFNPPRTYKYIKAGIGYVNDAPSRISLWVPAAWPNDDGTDVCYRKEKDSPVKWAAWSVGPGEARSVWEAQADHVPVPPRLWYPDDPHGIIVRLYTGADWVTSQ